MLARGSAQVRPPNGLFQTTKRPPLQPRKNFGTLQRRPSFSIVLTIRRLPSAVQNSRLCVQRRTFLQVRASWTVNRNTVRLLDSHLDALVAHLHDVQARHRDVYRLVGRSRAGCHHAATSHTMMLRPAVLATTISLPLPATTGKLKAALRQPRQRSPRVTMSRTSAALRSKGPLCSSFKVHMAAAKRPASV